MTRESQKKFSKILLVVVGLVVQIIRSMNCIVIIYTDMQSAAGEPGWSWSITNFQSSLLYNVKEWNVSGRYCEGYWKWWHLIAVNNNTFGEFTLVEQLLTGWYGWYWCWNDIMIAIQSVYSMFCYVHVSDQWSSNKLFFEDVEFLVVADAEVF